MKKFLLKSLLLTTTVMLLLYGASRLYDAKNDPNGARKLLKETREVRIANTGSSHGLYGFNYGIEELDGINCFNYAVNGQIFSYDYRVLQCFGDYFSSDGGLLFIPVSYFSFYADPIDSIFTSRNSDYYGVLEPRLIQSWDWKVQLNSCFKILNKRPNEIPKSLTEGSSYTNRWLKQKSSSPDVDLVVEGSGLYSYYISDREYVNPGQINLDEVEALYGIIDWCRQRGITPVLITTPLRHEFTDLIPDTFYDDFYWMVDVVRERTGVSYYDYARDERFSYSYDYFFNADHLSFDGAAVFTRILTEEVPELKELLDRI